MGSETFSDFLIPLKFTLDEPSKKKFDAAVGEVEKKFAAIGAAAGAAAVALSFAVKEISKNLAQLAYSAERVGASSEELKALGTAADRVGIGAEAAKSSLSGFFAFVNFEGGASVIKQWFKVDNLDIKHPLKAMLDSAVNLADTYATGTVTQRQTAIREAQRIGVDQTLLTTPGAARRLRDEVAKDEAFTGGKLNPIAEKAKRLNAEFEKVKQHLQDIWQLTSGPLQDSFSDLLEITDGWLKAHKDDIIWFSNKSAEIADELLRPNLKKFLEEITPNKQQKEDFLAFTKKISDSWKIVGDTYRSFWDGSIANKINAALEWAFQPFKWLWDKLQSLGLVGAGSGIGPGGGTGAGAVSSRGGHVEGGSFSAPEGTAHGGHGAQRRARFGHGGAIVGGGAMDSGGGGGRAPEGQLRDRGLRLMNDLITKYGYTPESAAMAAGQAEAESNINPSGPAGDAGASVGMFQDQGPRRTALRAFQAAHPEMSAWESNIAFYAQEKQQRAWQHEHSMARAGEMGHATEGYGDTTEGKRTRMANAWLRLYNERKKVGAPSPITPNIPDFHKRLEEIRAAKPLAPWQQSMNEHHDNRIHNSNIEIKVAGDFPVDKTARPLERSKNAALIRNTTSTAA